MTQTNNVPRLRFPGFSEDWGIKKLSDITRRISDGIHTTPKYDDRGVYYFINGNNFVANRVNISESTRTVSREEYIKYKKDLDENTILMSINGTIGSLARYNNEPVILGKSACYINICDEINREYIYNFLKTYRVKTYFNSELSGSTIKNLSIKTIKNTSVPVPDISEQKKIADFLTAIDEKITIIDKKIELLKQYKKGAMQKVFSQQIRFKDETGKDYPAWQHITLDDVLTFARNGLSIEQNTRNLGRKVTRIETISTGSVNPMKTGYIDTDLDISEYKLKVGDLLFSNINSPSQIGRTVYVDREYDIYHGMNLLCLRVDNENSPLYVYYLLTSHKYKQYFEAICNKAVNQASINQTDLKKTKIVMPSKEEQCKVADFLASLDDKIKLTEEQLVQAKTFKKSLLQRMFV